MDDIQAVRKSSIYQCPVLVNFCFLGSIKKILVFLFQETPTPTLTINLFENRDLEWYSRAGVTLFDKLIYQCSNCQVHPVFLSDISSDVTGVENKYSVYRQCSTPLPKQFCLGFLPTRVFSKAENGDVFMSHPVYANNMLYVLKITLSKCKT